MEQTSHYQSESPADTRCEDPKDGNHGTMNVVAYGGGQESNRHVLDVPGNRPAMRLLRRRIGGYSEYD